MDLNGLRQVEARTRLAKMVTRLFEHWGVSEEDQLRLLGYSPKSIRLLRRYQSGHPLVYRKEVIARVGLFLSIHKSLRIIFPHNRDLVYDWPSHKNAKFEGKAPLDVMINDISGLKSVAVYLQHQSEL